MRYCCSLFAVLEMFGSSSQSSQGSSSQSSQSSRRYTGNDWVNKLWFEPDVGKQRGYFIKEDKLVREIGKYLDPNDKIKSITAYKVPLFETMQVTQGVLYHEYIVLKTKKWYWSIEKTAECIHLERSKSETNVKDKRRGEPRLMPRSQWRPEKTQSIKDVDATINWVLSWLIACKWVKQGYHVAGNNCQNFVESFLGNFSPIDFADVDFDAC